MVLREMKCIHSGFFILAFLFFPQNAELLSPLRHMEQQICESLCREFEKLDNTEIYFRTVESQSIFTLE